MQPWDSGWSVSQETTQKLIEECFFQMTVRTMWSEKPFPKIINFNLSESYWN